MNAIQFHIIMAVVAVVAAEAPAAASAPKMTWADVFKDAKREQRSQHSTRKSYLVSHAFQPDTEQEQYSLQYIDGYGDGQYGDQGHGKENLLTTTHDLTYLTVKDLKGYGKEKALTSVKSPLSFVYTEPAQHTQHDLVTETYKYVTVPQKYQAQPFTAALQSGHHYLKLEDHHESSHDESYASKYKFGYRVSDPHTGAEFGHSEVSEGHVKKGQYHVLLPDGRLQNVKYWADPSGYHATVTYEGHAHHYPAYH